MSSASGPSTGQTAAPSSIFKSMLDTALAEYKKKTGDDLLALWLASELQTCESADSVLDVLRGQAKAFEQSDDNQKLIKWIDPLVNVLFTFSDALGDGISLAFPPAKVIFTGISALLGAAKDVRASHGAIIELFERIQSFFKRLDVYTQISLTTQMAEVLVKIVIELLSILSIATKEVRRRRAKLFGRKLLGRTDIEDALKRLDSLIQEEVQMAIAQILKATTEVKDGSDRANIAVQQVLNDVQEVKCDVVEVKGDVVEVKRDVGEVKCDVEEVKWAQIEQDILKWFSPPDPSTNYNIACETQSEGTAAWFLQGTKFKNWLLSGSLLWIHGKPGSGKSILCSATINHVMSLRDDGEASLAYFYFDFRDEEKKQDFRNFIKSLLVQLSAYSTPCCKIISHIYSTHAKGTQQPSNDVLKACLREMLSAVAEKPIYIIVDALDECPDLSGMPTPREDVLNLLESLVLMGLPNLRLYVTSRPEVDIQNVLEPLTGTFLSLHDEYGQKKDISDYVTNVVHTDKKMRRWRSDQKDLVVKELSKKADGMFRWVFCQLEVLRHCLPASIQQTLDQLPQSLDDTYLRALNQIPQANQSHAHRMLQCLVVAVRPLYVEELAELLAFDFDAATGGIPKYRPAFRLNNQTQAVLSTCSSLVTIVNEHWSRRQVVQFSHFSVQEFLVSCRLASSLGDLSRYHIRLGSAHTILAQTCLGLLLHSDDHSTAESEEGFPLAEYATIHWVEHVHFEDVATRVKDGIETLFDPEKPHFAAWADMYDNAKFPGWHDTGIRNPFYYSILCGFDDLIEHLAIKHPHYINGIGGESQNPLFEALVHAHLQAAESLLEHGADVDARDANSKTILLMVLSWLYDHDNLLNMVKLLLKHGADVNARDDSFTSPLHLAEHHGKQDVAQILLNHNADVNAQDGDGKTPLHVLLESNRWDEEDVSNHLRLLLEHGVDVNSRDKYNESPLHLAMLSNRFKLAVILLEHGANATAENGNGMASWYMLSEGFEHATRLRQGRGNGTLLQLERDAEVTKRDKNNDTLLHQAIRRHQLKLASLLVEHGADVVAKNKYGLTPLHLLIGSRSDFQLDGDAFNLARLLLDHGAKTNGTLIQQVLAWDGFKWFHFENLDPEIAIHEGASPLHRLSERGMGDKVLHLTLLFLEHGAEVNITNGFNEAPLHLAIRWKHFKLAELLLKHGADPNAEDSIGSTPMHVLSVAEIEIEYEANALNFAHLLLKHGAQVNRQDDDKQTPLHLAIQCDQFKLAKILVEHGANPNAGDHNGKTPLHKLSESDIENEDDVLHLAYLLLKYGAEVNRRDKRSRTPLHAAIRWDLFRLARVLVEHGADTNAENSHGMTSLHILTKKYQGDILDLALLLLENGAEVNSRNKVNETPLHLAIRRDQFELAGILLGHGADVNAENNNGETPLPVPLLSNGVDVTRGDGDNKALLLQRIDAQSNVCPFQIATLLLYRDATLNTRQKNGAEPESPSYPEIEDTNVQEESDLNPLHLASFYGWVEMVRAMLDHGATVHSEDNMGRTPLHLVAIGTSRDIRPDSVGIVELLLEYGADSNAQDKRKKTPLHLASYYGNVEIVRVLLGRGANANAKDALGLTPLHMVSCDTDFEFSQDGVSVAYLLLEQGADVNAEDHDHATPLDFARYGRPEIASLLLQYGDNDDIKIDVCPPSPKLENCDFTDSDYSQDLQ